eukprot:TRINITY_DN3405_c0_g1_i5.p1 TRINITY_DN3405_c0_g1~~TRINITY_DN3405_c0_g1_i5.p1  ORF type:complete len:372 (+),score=45.82 TRINITY_DN3405_c0_g1_i5:73-1188(+)
MHDDISEELEDLITFISKYPQISLDIRTEILEKLRSLLKRIRTVHERNDDKISSTDTEETYHDFEIKNEDFDFPDKYDDNDAATKNLPENPFTCAAKEESLNSEISKQSDVDDNTCEQLLDSDKSNIDIGSCVQNVANSENKIKKQKRKPKQKEHLGSKIVHNKNVLALKTENEPVKQEYSSSDGNVVERFYCDQCAYSSSLITNLKLHIENHHSTVQYPCDECEYVACAKNFLRRHKARVHGGLRYYCELCEYNTTCMSNLKRHKQSKHEGVKYTCEECNYSATLKQSLQRHISTKHKGIKFPCNKCSFSANHISDLNKHKKRMHKDLDDGVGGGLGQLKENKCDQCHFTAQTYANLKKHKKIKHNFTDL